MTKTAVSMLAAGFLAVAAPSAFAATNLLTNGSFQTGSPGSAPAAPWSVTGTATIATSTANAGNDVLTTGSPDAGSTQDLTFTGTTASTLSQTVSVTAGQSYAIGYDAALYGGGATNVTTSVTINGVTLAGLAINTSTAFGWTTKMVYWIANTTGSVTLQITDTNASTQKLAVDRVFVATPEPSSMAVLAVSLVGLWRFRSRRAR
jgi:PEP-CTERM motif